MASSASDVESARAQHSLGGAWAQAYVDICQEVLGRALTWCQCFEPSTIDLIGMEGFHSFSVGWTFNSFTRSSVRVYMSQMAGRAGGCAAPTLVSVLTLFPLHVYRAGEASTGLKLGVGEPE